MEASAQASAKATTNQSQQLALVPDPHGQKSIDWQPWSDDLFTRATAEKKMVVLDLHAVWCHWCHVMDETTYRNTKVIQLIQRNFIPVSVDQDSRPDLANRYEDYGWPATVIFNADGKENKILTGYASPDEFAHELQDCLKNPTRQFSELAAGRPKASAQGFLSDSLRQEIEKRFVERYDTKRGGWTYDQKFIPRENVEYAMVQAAHGDKLSADRAKEVLSLETKLMDPVWGGFYQYSTDGDWDHPHFEKIMDYQAGNLRLYSLAYLLFNDPKYLQVAEKTFNYLHDFLLSPEGAFYATQDADLVPGEHSADYFALDDAGRRKLGVPKVDFHVYPRENGWAIEALTFLYSASGDEKYLDTAERAANWITAHRKVDNGFFHDQYSKQYYLADNLSMARAFLALYSVNADRKWLKLAEETTQFISGKFVQDEAGSVLSDGNASAAGTVPTGSAIRDRDTAGGASSGEIPRSQATAVDSSASGFAGPGAGAGIESGTATVQDESSASDQKPRRWSNVVGLVTAAPPSAAGNSINLDENIAAARFFNLLYHYTGNSKYKDLAFVAGRYVTAPATTKKRVGIVGGILLVNDELASDPAHLVVVAPKGNAAAANLFLASLKYALAFRQNEWFDPKEGLLPGQQIEYPSLDKPAVFTCSGGACSAPVYAVDDLKRTLTRLVSR
jgi:uncharacterized protein YyaL (SSP411 family)